MCYGEKPYLINSINNIMEVENSVFNCGCAFAFMYVFPTHAHKEPNQSYPNLKTIMITEINESIHIGF